MQKVILPLYKLLVEMPLLVLREVGQTYVAKPSPDYHSADMQLYCSSNMTKRCYSCKYYGSFGDLPNVPDLN